ncbi:hypothetical protein L1887_59476 [Cichorium endivia]|nr:hypothetical protein L1887_59476 [Cichorium endivia]
MRSRAAAPSAVSHHPQPLYRGRQVILWPRARLALGTAQSRHLERRRLDCPNITLCLGFQRAFPDVGAAPLNAAALRNVPNALSTEGAVERLGVSAARAGTRPTHARTGSSGTGSVTVQDGDNSTVMDAAEHHDDSGTNSLGHAPDLQMHLPRRRALFSFRAWLHRFARGHLTVKSAKFFPVSLLPRTRCIGPGHA